MAGREGSTWRRVFRDKVRSKMQWIYLDCVRFGSGEAGCVAQAYGLAEMNLCAVARRQVVLYIALLNQAHGSSSQLVAYLKDARLERKPGMPKARKGKDYFHFKHTPNTDHVPPAFSADSRIRFAN